MGVGWRGNHEMKVLERTRKIQQCWNEVINDIHAKTKLFHGIITEHI